MKKVELYVILLFSIIFTSCKKEVRDYYENGNLKASYYKKDGKKHGIYKGYYNNNILKDIHHFYNDKLVDSSIYYHAPPNENKIKRIQYWGDSLNYQINYGINGRKVDEGNILPTKKGVTVGLWKFYNKKGFLDSIREYYNISGKPYINQVWHLNKLGDTLNNRGNFFKILYKDTINLDEVAKFRFILEKPFFGFKSESEVVIPIYNEDLKSDFSNLNKIERDTFYSLKNDNIPHPEIPKYVIQNQVIEFGLDYDEPGEKRLRGILIEYTQRYKGDIVHEDSLERIERRLYFDKTFFIKKD